MSDVQEAPFTVLRPGKMARGFFTSLEAVEYLVAHPGEAHLYGPHGLIMSKGVLSAKGGMREDKRRRPEEELSHPLGPGPGC